MKHILKNKQYYDEYYSSIITSNEMKCHHICYCPVLTKN